MRKLRYNVSSISKKCFSKQERECIAKKSKGRCACCGKVINPISPKFSIDHVIPITDGGTDDYDNLVPLCKSCNKAKGDKLVEPRSYFRYIDSNRLAGIERYAENYLKSYCPLRGDRLFVYDNFKLSCRGGTLPRVYVSRFNPSRGRYASTFNSYLREYLSRWGIDSVNLHYACFYRVTIHSDDPVVGYVYTFISEGRACIGYIPRIRDYDKVSSVFNALISNFVSGLVEYAPLDSTVEFVVLHYTFDDFTKRLVDELPLGDSIVRGTGGTYSYYSLEYSMYSITKGVGNGNSLCLGRDYINNVRQNNYKEAG